MLPRDGCAGDDRFDVLAQGCTEFRDFAVIIGYALETFGQVGAMLAHRRVDEVLARVMDGVRIHSHVLHYVAEQFEIRFTIVRKVLALRLEQVQELGGVSTYVGRLGHYMRTWSGVKPGLDTAAIR